jgi:DNA repair protein RecO
MIRKSRIIILNIIKHGESGVVVQGYSNTDGRIALFMKGVGRNKNYRAYLHRLNIVDAEIYSRGDAMPIIKELSPVKSLDSIRTDIYKNAIAIYMCELILKAIKEIEANETLFNFISGSIFFLEESEKNMANFPSYFLVHLCQITGFKPLDNYGDNKCLFDILSASYTSNTNIIRDEESLFSPTHSEFLHKLLNTPAIEIGNISSNGETRYKFVKKMLEYLSLHLGTPIELKSLDVLHEISSI